MKNNWILSLALTFCAFFAIGLWLGQVLDHGPIVREIDGYFQIASGRPANGSVQTSAGEADRLSDDGWLPWSEQAGDDFKQRSVLLVGVDDLSRPDPQLDSVWLVMYIPSMARLTIMPVYPSAFLEPDGLQVQFDQELADSFGLHMDGSLQESFVSHLQGRDLPWQHTIIVDQAGLAGVVGFARSLSSGQQPASRGNEGDLIPPEIAQASNLEAVPVSGLLERVTVAQEICRLSNQASLTPGHLRQLYRSMSGHFITDLEPEWFIRELGLLLRYGTGLSCAFPWLEKADPGLPG